VLISEDNACALLTPGDVPKGRTRVRVTGEWCVWFVIPVAVDI
jgi:hypothetical protein